MRITIEPTPHFFMAGEVMVRMWQGTDATGVEVIAFVAAVAVGGESAENAAAGLVSIPPPGPLAAAAWAREVERRQREASRQSDDDRGE